jgi:hypothetical protein
MSIDTETPRRRVVNANARERREAKRDLVSHLAAYVVVNASLIGIWMMTGGYFWPAWVIGLWGAGLLLNAWDVFRKRPL